MDKKRTLEFVVKGPITLFLEEDKQDQRSGCSILDISFPEPVTISDIIFRNYYAASLSMSIKKVPLDKDVRNRDMLPWILCIKHFTLMPDPHCEQGSQEFYEIPSTMSTQPWTGIVSIRFILKQPSSYWRKFGIEDVTFYKEPFGEKKAPTYVPRMFNGVKTLSLPEESGKEDVVNRLQNLKAIIELMKEKHTGAGVGRFEVDGSYDLTNLT